MTDPTAPQTKNAAAEHLRRRLDGWANAFTGLGTTRDKRTAGDVAEFERVPYETLVALYRTDPMAARIVDRPAEEMLREGFEIRIAGDKDASEAVEHWLEQINAAAALRLALQWRRAYGGAGVLLGVNGGDLSAEELASPLRPEDVQSIDHITVYTCRELQAVAYYADPLRPNFGEPAIYRIVPQVPFNVDGTPVINMGATKDLPPDLARRSPGMAGVLPEVHESRILRFNGRVANRRQLLENWGWGDGVLQVAFETLRDFAQTNGAAWHLVQDFAQGILTIPGLIDSLAGDGGETARARAEMLDTMRSIARMLVLDGGDSTGAGKEDFRRDVASLTSIPEILDRVAFLLAAAADMPVSLLMGTRLGTGGLGSTADGDARDWYDHVRDMQKTQLLPPLRRLAELGMRASKGPMRGKLPPLWSIEFNPLWQPSDSERATLRSTMAQADEKMIALGVLQPDEVRESRFGGDGYSIETQLDTGTREAFERETDDEIDPKTLREGETGEQVDPAALATGEGGAPAGANLQALALNGTQITGMLAIVDKVRDGTLPVEAAVIALCAAFPFTFDEVKARALLSKIEVKEPPEPPDPIELAKAKAQGAPPMPGSVPPNRPAVPPGKGAP